MFDKKKEQKKKKYLRPLSCFLKMKRHQTLRSTIFDHINVSLFNNKKRKQNSPNSLNDFKREQNTKK